MYTTLSKRFCISVYLYKCREGREENTFPEWSDRDSVKIPFNQIKLSDVVND